MIRNDQEMEATQGRIAYLHSSLARLRVTTTPDEFAPVASDSRIEILRMQNEILDYLTRHASEPMPFVEL
jgi:hypothetical protein